jgi:hypothetical protein
MHSDRRLPLSLLALLFLCVPLALHAQIPQPLAYQGLLTDAGGTPVPDGTYRVTFRLYAGPAAPEPVWQETQALSVRGGLFSALLGGDHTLSPAPPRPGSAADAEGYYLSVAVEDQAESARTVLSGLRGDDLEIVAGDGIRVERADGRFVISTSGASAEPLGPGGSNLGLDAAYDAGPVVTVDGPPVELVGTTGGLALRVRNGDILFSDETGANPNLRFRTSGGAAGTQEWRFNLPGSTGNLALRNQTSGRVPVGVARSAVDDLLLLFDNIVGVGSPTQTASVQTYLSGSADPVTYLGDSGGSGGELSLYDALGVRHAFLEPGIGSSGRLGVNSGAGGGFFVAGDASGAGDPGLYLTGTSRSAFFEMAAVGDNSVVLPVDAISRAETVDEPGAANSHASFVALTTSNQILLTRTITAPTSGSVIAFGAVESGISHVSGTISNIQYGLSTDCDASPTLPSDQDFQHVVPSGAPSGPWNITISPMGLFEVPAGATTFCLVGREVSADASAFDLQLTLLFVPTSYGTVQPNVQGASSSGDPNEAAVPRAALSAADVEAERMASMAADQARMARELEAMTARVEALSRRLEEALKARPDGSAPREHE